MSAAHSVKSASVLSCVTPITNARNAELEVEASTSFLRIVHAALPTASIDFVKLLCLRGGKPDDGGGKPHTSRKFTQARFTGAFVATQDALKDSMLSEPLPANDQAIRWHTEIQGGRTFKAKHVSHKFDQLQVDCMVKVAVRSPADIVWGVDPSITEAVGVRLQPLDGPARMRDAPDATNLRLPLKFSDSEVAAEAATAGDSSGLKTVRHRRRNVGAVPGRSAASEDGSGAVAVSVAPSEPPPLYTAPPLPSGAAAVTDAGSLSSASSVDGGTSTTSSRILYETDANMYVVAEVYVAQHGDDSDAERAPAGSGSVGDSGVSGALLPEPCSRPVGRLQKLLQLERIVTFLCMKERKPVLECVAGAMFIATSLDTKMLALMRATLSDNSARFPCLQSLRLKGRLLVIHMPEHRLAGHLAQVDLMKLTEEVRALSKAVATQGEQITAQGEEITAAIRDAIADAAGMTESAEHVLSESCDAVFMRWMVRVFYLCVIVAVLFQVATVHRTDESLPVLPVPAN
jgi:hypothetical protein